MANPPGRFENVRGIVRDDVDSVQLSEGLRGHGNEDTRLVPLKHIFVGPLAFLALEQDVHLDVTEFFTGPLVVDITTAVQVSDDNNAFLVVIVVKKPPINLVSPG